ncbi:MAG TPA: arsenate reductase (thioredoxin) [Methylophaga sp.]|nr:arsenate reductase (thioredoxin) [Methylophaga sp.]
MLFLCTGNSCRSQIAEGWAKWYGKPLFDIQSAGIETHGKNPRAIAVMKEAGVDISNQESSKVSDDMLARANLVVTVCSHADEHCPILPPGTKKEHWPLEDPAKAQGSEEEIMDQFRASRDNIEARVKDLLQRFNNKTTEE